MKKFLKIILILIIILYVGALNVKAQGEFNLKLIPSKNKINSNEEINIDINIENAVDGAQAMKFKLYYNKDVFEEVSIDNISTKLYSAEIEYSTEKQIVLINTLDTIKNGTFATISLKTKENIENIVNEEELFSISEIEVIDDYYDTYDIKEEKIACDLKYNSKYKINIKEQNSEGTLISGESKSQYKITMNDGTEKVAVQDAGEIALSDITSPEEGEKQIFKIQQIVNSMGEGVATDITTVEITLNEGVLSTTAFGGNIRKIKITENKNIEIVMEDENKVEELYLTTDKYKIGNQNTGVYEAGDSYITRISPNTTLNEFLENCHSNGVINVLSKDGTVIQGNEIIGTGMKIKVSKDGKENIILTIVVIGDINGNGKVDTGDLTMLRGNIYENNTLNELYLKALDIDESGKINTRDLTLIRGAIYENKTLV